MYGTGDLVARGHPAAEGREHLLKVDSLIAELQPFERRLRLGTWCHLPRPPGLVVDIGALGTTPLLAPRLLRGQVRDEPVMVDARLTGKPFAYALLLFTLFHVIERSDVYP